jgi:hypothetical protein
MGKHTRHRWIFRYITHVWAVQAAGPAMVWVLQMRYSEHIYPLFFSYSHELLVPTHAPTESAGAVQRSRPQFSLLPYVRFGPSDLVSVERGR